MLVGGPLYIFAITRSDLTLLLALVTISAVLQFGYLGITFASLQNLMHPRMRATASAVLNAIYAVAGALGPMILGAISDRLEPDYAPGEGPRAGDGRDGARLSLGRHTLSGRSAPCRPRPGGGSREQGLGLTSAVSGKRIDPSL